MPSLPFANPSPRKPRHRTPPASQIRRSCNGMVLCAALLRMEKDFDRWNEKKKYTHKREFADHVHEREVWWSALGVNIGVEKTESMKLLNGLCSSSVNSTTIPFSSCLLRQGSKKRRTMCRISTKVRSLPLSYRKYV